MKPRRPTYSRIECEVDGCRRGTTRLEPGTEWICAVHWREVPEPVRRNLALFRRKIRAAVRKGDHQRAERCDRIHAAIWARAKRVFHEDPAPGELSARMGEALRRIGL